MSSPFRNYDQWLTTDTAADAAEAYADHVADAWVEFAESSAVSVDAQDEAHAEHAIYQAWKKLFVLVEQHQDKLLAQEEWAAYEREEQEQAAYEAAMAEADLAAASEHAADHAEMRRQG